jgi:ATP-dependent protease ClpP protease subunit
MPDDIDTPEPARPETSAFERRLRGWAESSERRFEANMAANGDVLELQMLDIVGEDWWTGGGITSQRVQEKLSAYPKAKTVKVLLNSPGGDAFEGLAIQSLLRRHGARVEVEVVGLAASAASIIAMAGDEIAMHEGALMMIHEPWTMTVGNATEMRTAADFLEKVNASGLDVYTRRTGRKRADVADMLAAETWMTAHEAVAEKFATSVVAGAEPAPKAKSAMQAFMSLRKSMQRVAPPAEDAPPQPTPAIPASPPVATATPGESRKGPTTMKFASAPAFAAALGITVEQLEQLDENGLLQAIQKRSAPQETVIELSGVKLLGVATEADAATKVQQLTRVNSALMAATGASTDHEALARVMSWKGAADREPEHVKQISELKTSQIAAAKEASIQKLSREGKLAPAMHDWARANFQSGEALEAFCAALPPMVQLGAHEPKDPTDSMTLSASEKEVARLLNLSEDDYLAQKKLEAKQRAARVGG